MRSSGRMPIVTMDRRRHMIVLLGILGAPWIVRAQGPGKVVRIGILAGAGTGTSADGGVWNGFFGDLRDFGYLEGRNLALERRYYDDVAKQLPAFAAELVRLNVDIIVTGAVPAPEAAKRATSAIPIVMTSHPDPVGSGLVASLARPGGNITGLCTLSKELRAKQLQLLKELLPKLGRVAVLMSPEVPSHLPEVQEINAAASSLNVQTIAARVREPSEFAEAFAFMKKQGTDAFVLLGSAMFFVNRSTISDLAAKYRLPGVTHISQYADAGLLMTYGASLSESYRRAAWYVDQIIKGAKPAGLPIEQPTKFELVINMQTARALGIAIPPPLLARANHLVK